MCNLPPGPNKIPPDGPGCGDGDYFITPPIPSLGPADVVKCKQCGADFCRDCNMHFEYCAHPEWPLDENGDEI